jgi:hypothetical protein
VGYRGHKEKTKDEQLTKGIKYLADKITIPTFLCKENLVRTEKEPLNWLFPIDKFTSKTEAAFEFTFKIIDPAIDFVKGVNIYASSPYIDIAEKFSEMCERHGVKNFEFENVKKDKEARIGEQIANIVNFGETPFHFIACGHNPDKYKSLDETPLIDIVKQSQANILFKR